MNVIRGMLHRREAIDFQKHDEIQRQMHDVTTMLRAGDPISQMVRGVWKSDTGREIIVLESTPRDQEEAPDV